MTFTAIILAAGQGRKFWPYNEVRNKCAFPICNKPVVLRLAEQALSLGAEGIVCVVSYEERSVRAALAELGDSVLFVRQDSSDCGGTTPALLSAISATDDAENLLVLYGDSVIHMQDLVGLRDIYLGSHPIAAALCAPLTNERSGDWITADLAVREGGGHGLAGVDAHGRGGTHRFAGAYFLNSAVLPTFRSQPGYFSHIGVGAMPANEADIADALATLKDAGHDIALVETDRPSCDLDKPWHILEATSIVLKEMAELLAVSVIADGAKVSDSADISGHIYVEAGAEIGKRAVIEGPAWIGANARIINGAIIGKGCMIGAESRVSDYCLLTQGSTLGRGCVLGHGGEMDGVMLDKSYIYHYSEIYGVLGLAVDIGAATVCGTLRFDDAETIHKINGRREFPRDHSNATYFGDYSRTGVNVITQPGVKIGAYSCVGAGIVLYKDVPSRKLVLLKQETEVREWGPVRYGW